MNSTIDESQVYKLILGLSRTADDCEYLSGRVARVIRDVPGSITYLAESLSQGQLKSKRWLIDETIRCFTDIGVVYHCAGWTGLISNFLFRSGIQVEKIRLFDIDSKACIIADRLNSEFMANGWKFKSITKDIHDIEFIDHKYAVISNNGNVIEQCESANTVINTSCEHINNFDTWYNKIPEGTKVILQSNNFYSIPEHINCCHSIDDFAKQTPMSSVLFSGVAHLDLYDRFMRIGIK